MRNYVESNQSILYEWQSLYEKNGGDGDSFCFDGLMFRGKKSRDECNHWIHECGDKDNELWNKVPIRVLYLTKDQPKAAWDLRKEAYHHPNSEYDDNKLWRRYAFHRNLVRSMYGLIKTTPESFMEFEDIDESKALKFSDTYPYARINCKKEAGNDDCQNGVLIESMEKYSELLIKQISNLDADIIICCGHQQNENVILKFLNTHGYNFEETDKDSDVYYDSKRNKIAIDAYHLSFCYNEKDYYNEIVKTYYEFIRSHPAFIQSHR